MFCSQSGFIVSETELRFFVVVCLGLIAILNDIDNDHYPVIIIIIILVIVFFLVVIFIVIIKHRNS